MTTKMDIHPSTRVEIDLDAIQHNYKQVRALTARNTFQLPSRGKIKEIHTAPMGIMAVVKADAYGHGVKYVAPLLDQLGVEYFGVSDVQEGVQLRALGIQKPILLFESTLKSHVATIVDCRLTSTVCTLDFARKLSEYGQATKKLVKVHVEIDTGMGRFGVWAEEALNFIQKINRMKSILVEGIFTHFPVADTDRKYTQNQVKQLYELVSNLDRQGQIIPYIHCANSMGLIGYETSVLNLSRPGLMLYGLHPNEKTKDKINLKPAMSVRSQVIFVKNIQKGRSISYGRTFVAKKAMKVATIPIGYNDGYLREFSNNGEVLISGQRCPVIGHVTMDQIIVDVSHLKTCRVGSEVMIVGTQKKETISADVLAKAADTINYEIVCQFGNRLGRVIRTKKSMSRSSKSRS